MTSAGMTDRAAARRAGRPRKDEVDALEQSLLEAAQTVFLAKGYASTTLTEIAALARASKRTIYQRHPNKAALFEKAISAFIDEKFAPLERLPLQQRPLREKLLRLAEALASIAADEATIAVHRVAAAEQREFPDLINRLRRHGFARAVHLVRSILDEHGVENAVIAAEIFYATFVLAPLEGSLLPGSLEPRVDFVMRGLISSEAM
jgi:AcrR family transcriptional regulator